jgi:hypothetical protein
LDNQNQIERNSTMTAPTPVLPTDTGQLGPGVLKIGETGTSIDVSCYVNNVAIESASDTTDSTTKLCGAVRKGVTTFTFQLTGNIDVDAGNASGLFALTWNEAGSEQAFEFTPSTDLGTTATGTLVVQPLRFGADEYGSDLTSDFTWDIIGTPVLTFDGGGGGTVATGATAGTPGSYTPSGSVAPANLAGLAAVTASPTTAWTTGQYVVTADTQHNHWDGTAWATGDAA